MAWREGQLTEATVHSSLGNPCTIRLGDKTVRLKTKRGQTLRFDHNLHPKS